MASTAIGNCGARAAALPSPDTEQVPLTASTGQGHGRGTLWLQYWHCACAAACTVAHWPPGGARCSARPGAPRNLYGEPGRPRTGGRSAAMRVAGWAGLGAVHVGPAADPGPAGSSGRCGGWGAAMAAGPESRLSPRVPRGGSPPCPRHPRALPAPLYCPQSPCRGFPAFRGDSGARAPQPRGAPGSLRRVRGARRHRAGSALSGGGDGRGGLPRSCK